MKKTIIAIIMIMVTLLTTTTANAASLEEDSVRSTMVGVEIRIYLDQMRGYDSATSSNALVYIPRDTKLTVIAEEADRFQVNYDGQLVWVSATNVLVNIAQYIPTLTIQLAMAQEENYFQMADEDIANLTNHQFYTSAGSVNGTEAWLKYEPAQKLATAQAQFLSDGYSIIIYDAYRPYSCSMSFKDAYSQYLSTKTADFKNQWFGELGESWFLAQNASSHNYGVAVDMSLINLATGEVVNMPSAIHTLDCRSALCVWENAGTEESAMASYMKNVMESNGFSSLKSEWWHFQDNSAKTDLIDIAN